MGEDYENKDIVGDDFAEYSPKSEYSKPSLLFEASQRCALLRAKEMRKGYSNITIDKNGMQHKVWIEDSRKVYCSSVIALKILLNPEIREDTKFNNMDEDFENLFESYAYCKIKKIKEGKYLKDETDFYMPEVDSVVQVIEVLPGGMQTLKEVPGFWNREIDSYWNEMVTFCDILLSKLMDIIHRKNYFKQSKSQF